MKNLTFSEVDLLELNRLSGIIGSCNKQIVEIQQKAFDSGVKLKEISQDPKLVPLRELAIRCHKASCRILQRSYR